MRSDCRSSLASDDVTFGDLAVRDAQDFDVVAGLEIADHPAGKRLSDARTWLHTDGERPIRRNARDHDPRDAHQNERHELSGRWLRIAHGASRPSAMA